MKKIHESQAACGVCGSSMLQNMSRKDKISFIMTSRDSAHVYRDLKALQDRELDDLIRNIVKRLVIESHLIAHMYISDVKIFPN